MADTDLRSVITWFESAEQMLMAVLDVIPYETFHENVWSPRLVTVLLETCSQLDSLFKQQAIQSPSVTSQSLNITDYFSLLSDKTFPASGCFSGASRRRGLGPSGRGRTLLPTIRRPTLGTN